MKIGEVRREGLGEREDDMKRWSFVLVGNEKIRKKMASEKSKRERNLKYSVVGIRENKTRDC